MVPKSISKIKEKIKFDFLKLGEIVLGRSLYTESEKSVLKRNRLLTSVSGLEDPFQFSTKITNNAFDSEVIKSFYRSRDINAITGFSNYLGDIFRLSQNAVHGTVEILDNENFNGPVYEGLKHFLAWDLQHFKHKGDRKKTAQSWYNHQLQSTATLGAYIYCPLYFEGEKKFPKLDSDSRQVLIYSMLAHDTLEDGKLNGKNVSKEDLEAKLRQCIHNEANIDSILTIVEAVTRLDEAGTELEYEEACNKFLALKMT
jgi:hypothetical protein